MLKVRVELLPGGLELGRRVIATVDIARIRDGDCANYNVVAARECVSWPFGCYCDGARLSAMVSIGLRPRGTLPYCVSQRGSRRSAASANPAPGAGACSSRWRAVRQARRDF
jgi:hypothetical protein